MLWTKKQIAKRTSALRHTLPKKDTLQELFEMQNRICDLCGHLIQDLVLAVLDHSVSVSWFAKSDLDIETAALQCNHLTNLRAAHGKCNHIKLNKTRDEWFALGMDKMVERPHTYSLEELAALRQKMSERGRATNATTNGRKGNGGRTPGNRGGILGGKAVRDRKVGIFAPDFDRSAAGQKGGNSNAKNKTGICGRSFEKMSAHGRFNAALSIRKGTSMVLVPGMAAKANKIRWDRAFLKTVAWG
jgi:hypothetical protein